ncbi:MAG: methanogenesis marker 17 protein [Euryarchaeota archaeon]|mgnify:CR=1 FL=1|nr:methanogenesis marker 17 protein [Euryarchaeota archaeon]
MELEIDSTEDFGLEAYRSLFEEVMFDIGKLPTIEKARVSLNPHVPLFIFSVRFKSATADKTIGDIANVRTDEGNAHITVTDERYAPNILEELWRRYGRNAVTQQTRFDIDVAGAIGKEVEDIVISSGEDNAREMLGALWRSMPEGIKNRHTYIGGRVITVVATEELLLPEMLEAGLKVHEAMGGGS